MVFWNGFVKRVKNAITRKEFNDLKGEVNDNTNNIRINSADIATNRADIGNLGNRVDTNTRNIATNSNNIITVNNAISQLNTTINNLDQEKADKTQLDQYYTKSESDNRYYTKSQVYTKSESDNKFATITALQQTTDIANNANFIANDCLQGITDLTNNKANKSDVYDRTYINTNYYTKSQVDSKIVDLTKLEVFSARFASTDAFTKFNNNGMRFWGFSFFSSQINLNNIVSVIPSISIPQYMEVSYHVKNGEITIWVCRPDQTGDISFNLQIYVWRKI